MSSILKRIVEKNITQKQVLKNYFTLGIDSKPDYSPATVLAARKFKKYLKKPFASSDNLEKRVRHFLFHCNGNFDLLLCYKSEICIICYL